MILKTEQNTQRVVYTDFAKSFNIHPLTGDVIINKNEMAIREAILNIIFTNPNERPYSTFGIGIDQYLFEPIDTSTTLTLQNAISTGIGMYEPRCKVESVQVVPLIEDNAYDITIRFSLLNSPRIFSVNLSVSRLR